MIEKEKLVKAISLLEEESYIESIVHDLQQFESSDIGYRLGGTPAEEMASVKAALADRKAFSVDFTSVAVLPQEKIIAALAKREGALEEIHSKISGATDWTPHTELLRDDLMDLNWVRSAMAGMFQPFTATIACIEFLDGANVVDAIELRGEDA